MRSRNFIKRFVKAPEMRGATYIAIDHQGHLLQHYGFMDEPKGNELARDSEPDGSEARREPHKGYHKHVCGACGIDWDHSPEQCFLRVFARCLTCIREGRHASSSIN